MWMKTSDISNRTGRSLSSQRPTPGVTNLQAEYT